MKRRWLKVSEIDAYDEMHTPNGEGFDIPVPDPQDYAQHRKGVDFIKQILQDGVKTLPILVRDDMKRMDGFKRWQAHKELGYPLIEAFVCEAGEKAIYDGKEMRCEKGGQSYRRFDRITEYGEPTDQAKSDGKIEYLYEGKALRIEFREFIHLHWGDRGRNRLDLGKEDFDILYNALWGK